MLFTNLVPVIDSLITVFTLMFMVSTGIIAGSCYFVCKSIFKDEELV